MKTQTLKKTTRRVFLAAAVATSATLTASAASTTYRQVEIKNYEMDGLPATTEITSTRQLAFAGVTLDDICQCTFITQLYGPHISGYNSVDTSAASWSLWPTCHLDGEGHVDKLAVQCSVYDTGSNSKGVILVLTNGDGGVYVEKALKYYRGGNQYANKNFSMAADGTISSSYNNGSDYRAGGIRIHGMSPLNTKAQLAFPGANLAMFKNLGTADYVAGYRLGMNTGVPATNTVARYIGYWPTSGEVQKIAVQFTHPNDSYKVAVIELKDGEGGVYAQHVLSTYNNSGQCFKFDEYGNIVKSAGNNGAAGAYPIEEFHIAAQERPPCVTKTPNKIKVFADPSKTLVLNDITNGTFTATMNGGYVAESTVDGYNVTPFLDYAEGSVTNLIVEYQVLHGGYTKCVVVEFTEENGEIYATALWGPNKSGSHLGEVFYTGAANQRTGSNVAETSTAGGYGVCDLRVTMPTVHEWTLDSDKNWSDIPGSAAFESDEVVRITVTDADAVLTVDVNVNVAKIEFMDGNGATLSVSSGKTVTADDISGIGNIVNNGTLVKTGSETKSWPFSNDSTGVTIVSNGTLKVASKSGTGTSNPTHTVRVASGATFDANGVGNLTTSVVLEDGAFFVNTRADIGNTTYQTINLRLEGNANVTAGKNFGLMAPDYASTGIALGSNTLSFNGTAGFWLENTTITGDGTINVESGTLQCARANTTGANCTLNIGASGLLRIDGTKTLCVSNFYNGGKLANGNNFSGTGYGTLLVNGTLTTGNAMTNITLAAGATVKATGAPQVVSGTFSASGVITVDASEITKAQLDAGDVAVLTVPAAFNPSVITWDVSGAPVADARTKWRTDEGGATKTLYVGKPTGLTVIFW